MSTRSVRKFTYHAIGEVALRVRDMDIMVEFYASTLGLTLRRRFENDVAAFMIAEGVHGQVQTLTLFGPRMPSNFTQGPWPSLDADATTLHHFALTIAPEDYDLAIEDLSADDIPFTTANHRWCGWRGIYLRDPESNVIELVSYHEDFDEGKTGEYDFTKLHGAKSGQAFA